jgi:phosphotransferase system enzyme I (PtsI)
MEQRFKGIGASPGIGIGKVVVIEDKRPRFTYQFLLNKADIDQEVKRFQQAVQKVEQEIEQLKENLGHKAPFKEVKQILEAYKTILSDPMFFQATIDRIKSEKINAEWALMKSLKKIEEIFGEIEDEYLKQRIQDVHYVTNRVLNFLNPNHVKVSHTFTGGILIAHDLSPAEATKFSARQVFGFVTETGGLTSHMAIVAQALNLPAVVGVKDITAYTKSGDSAIVDGQKGIVIINPTDETLEKYKKKQKQYHIFCEEIGYYAHLPAQTLDGHTLRIMANVELFEEVPSILEMGAEGIGLFRTEFFYIQQNTLPEEETLYQYFARVVKAIHPYPVTFRTLDFGGDKMTTHLDLGQEVNPALGLRAIRFCLKQKDIFKTQLRAILRASVHGQVRLLFPLISSLEEILETKQILASLKTELMAEGYDFSPHIPMGIMVEVPSAVTLIDFFVKEVDFISIGTNDLIQYALAIDRNNEQVAYLYEPLHPAVLKMIYQIIKTAHKRGITVSVCGEMARELLYVPILVGLGVDEFSLKAQNIPLIKRVIRMLHFEKAHSLVQELLTMGSVQEIKKHYFQHLRVWLKDLEGIVDYGEGAVDGY